MLPPSKTSPGSSQCNNGSTLNQRASGKTGEDEALAFLARHGLILIERNFRTRGGEIDLIMQENDEIAFIEVRKRGSRLYGGALASVTFSKQKRLILAANAFLQRYRKTPRCRFDVVAIEPEGITWIRNAFDNG